MVQGLASLKNKLTRTIPQNVRKAAHDALEKGAQEIVSTAKSLAPRKSGDLINSIDYTFGNYKAENSNVRGVSGGTSNADPYLSVTVHAGDAKAFYAAWVEFGTAPHTIEPKRPGGLLNINGRLITSVAHPGASPSPFFYPAYRAHKKRAKSRLTRAMRKAIREGAA